MKISEIIEILTDMQVHLQDAEGSLIRASNKESVFRAGNQIIAAIWTLQEMAQTPEPPELKLLDFS